MNRNTQARQNAWRALAFLVLLGTLLVIPSTSRAQSLSNISNVTLNAAIQQSISVTVSAAAINFTLVPGTGPTAGAPTVTVTTNWALNPAGSPTMSLYGYFTSSTAALTNGAGNNIPSANILTSINAGAPVAFTGTGPFGSAGASRQIYTLGISGANKTGTRNDTLGLFINLTTQPNLPAGTYNGTLSLQAQVF